MKQRRKPISAIRDFIVFARKEIQLHARNINDSSVIKNHSHEEKLRVPCTALAFFSPVGSVSKNSFEKN